MQFGTGDTEPPFRLVLARFHSFPSHQPTTRHSRQLMIPFGQTHDNNTARNTTLRPRDDNERQHTTLFVYLSHEKGKTVWPSAFDSYR